jgi:hypothetical protein
MRSRSLFLVAAALLLLALPAGRVQAQQLGPRIPPQYGPGLRPTLSPYLNLLRGGDVSANYYLGVRTEFQRRDDRVNLYTRTRELEDRETALENRESALEDEESPTGGTASDFGSTLNYFTSPNTYYGKVTPGNINQGRPPSRQRGNR